MKRKGSAARQPRERTKGVTVKPTHTLELMRRVGVTRASEMLGVSMTTLHNGRKFGFVSMSLELAAELRLQQVSNGTLEVRPLARETTEPSRTPPHFTGGGHPITFLVEGPAKRETLETFINSVGGKLTPLSQRQFMLSVDATKRAIVEKFIEMTGGKALAA